MKDKDLRGILLRKFYDLRSSSAIVGLDGDELLPLTFEEYERIGRQLSEQNLLEWHPLSSGGGYGRITAFGIDVIEDEAKPPLAINLYDHSIAVHSSSNVQIGDRNTISANIDFAKVMSAIDQAPTTDQEKEEARGLFTRIFNNPTFASIAGAIAGMAGGSGGAH